MPDCSWPARTAKPFFALRHRFPEEWNEREEEELKMADWDPDK